MIEIDKEKGPDSSIPDTCEGRLSPVGSKATEAKDREMRRMVLPDAFERLKSRCILKAQKIYGQSLPEPVKNRLDLELGFESVRRDAGRFLIAAMIADRSRELGYAVNGRAMIGSSLLSYLCGITSVNPLHAHRWCPKCRYYEEFKGDHLLSGFDLPDRYCPECGTLMNADGADIRPEILFGLHHDAEVYFALNVSDRIRPDLFRYLKQEFGEDSVFRAGISVVDEKGAIRKGVHPGGVFILPRDTDIKTITPVRRPAAFEDKGLMITERDYRELSGILERYDLLPLPELTMLHDLESRTGIDQNRIRLNDPDVLRVFLQKGFSFLPGKTKGEMPSMEDRAVSSVRPGSFSELMRILAVLHGAETWNHNGELLIKDGISIRDLITSRDDVLEQLIAYGLDREAAYEIMNRVRKGKGLTSELEQTMKESNVPSWYAGSCKKILYLYSKSQAAEYMALYWKLAYYYLYYPKEYQEELNSLHLDRNESSIV